MSSLSPRDVGRRIRKIRGELSQSDFARRIGIPNQNGVSRYEKGRIPPPELLLRIARYGKVSIDWVLTGRASDGGSIAAEPRPVYKVSRPVQDLIPGADALTRGQKKLVAKLVRELILGN